MAKVSLKTYFALVLLLFLIIPLITLVFATLILIPSNDFSWMEGWLFIFVFNVLFLLYYFYFLNTDPQTLLNRSKQSSDSTNVIYSVIAFSLFLLIMIIPGFDRQFLTEIPSFPFVIEFIGFIGIIIGFIIVFLANRENTYASKGVRIHKGHQVITTGPYAVIRHPMYAGFFILF